jgi:hypothetical protein
MEKTAMAATRLPQLLSIMEPSRTSIRAVTAHIRSHWKASEFRHRARAAQLLQRRLMQFVQ